MHVKFLEGRPGQEAGDVRECDCDAGAAPAAMTARACDDDDAADADDAADFDDVWRAL